MRKMQKIDGRKLSKELQTEFRKHAIRAVKKGNTKISVAECLGTSRNIITKQCKKKTANTKFRRRQTRIIKRNKRKA